jgi:hypothetical protein
MFYVDETPEGFYTEQDRVAGCCEQLNGHLLFPQRDGDFLSHWVNNSFSRTLLHEVSTTRNDYGIYWTSLLKGGML